MCRKNQVRMRGDTSEGVPERKGQPWVEKSLGTRDKECAWFGKSKQTWRKKTSKDPDNYGSM